MSETDPGVVFTPEDLGPEDRQLAELAAKFMDKEVLPRLEALEHQEAGLAVRLFRQAGELGLLALELPEEWGGLGLGKTASIGVAEQLTRLAGFGITCGAHTGIGSQPVACFGTEAQKAKYLPRLATGEWMGAYCLSEAGSGSDALGMKTRAVLAPDGRHFLLNGAKMWITNAGWADLFTVFAKVEGEHVTAFLVERTFPGVSTGKEEHKLGLKSSSTRRVLLEDTPVPVENVLGGVGQGAYIAFNILNLGRFGLGAGVLGAAKDALRLAARYALERRQFGRSIASFGLIQHKLGEMAAKVFAAESAIYRTGAAIDAVMATGELLDSVQPAFRRGLDEFAIECSIAKVACSETLDRVADEALQIHGGYGFTEEFPAARICRDGRINRIFEGTNEINRLFIPTALLRRAQRGRLPWAAATAQAAREASAAAAAPLSEEPLQAARALWGNLRRWVLLLSGTATARFGPRLNEQQEVLAALSDLTIELYLGESALLRTLKAQARGAQPATMTDLTLVFINDSVARVEQHTRTALAAIMSGAELEAQLGLARRLLSWTPINTVAMRRRVAERLCAVGDYPALVAALP